MQNNHNHSKIWLSSPHMGGAEQKYVQDAFDTNWIAPLGPNVDGFERDLSAYTGVAHVATLSSGTAAIHLALIILGVGAGDEVICQSMTFSASANPILYQNATPIFIDSEKDTWNMCPDLLKQAIEDRLSKGKKPKAIIPVHLYGMPAKMDRIMEIANEYDIPVIEDAAEAIGSTYKGQLVGSFGQFGVLSFNGNKIITTSGGGALLSNNKEYIRLAKFYATQAKDDAPHYEHSKIGYNYRMSNICAGVGRGQMEVVSERIDQRRQNFAYYKDQLKHIPAIQFVDDDLSFFSNRWLTTILVEPSVGVTREDVRLHLESLNIECRPLWKPMHLQPVFADSIYYGGTVAEELFAKGLCLPSGSNLSREDLDRVVQAVSDCFNP
ncbi:MAG: pyridoxal phosphate-dependent aminotransferase [Pedobacter sp.]|nr:MAG: pyridoxal phosphate-dependent aminotransferase [Pedobacter sp.]